MTVSGKFLHFYLKQKRDAKPDESPCFRIHAAVDAVRAGTPLAAVHGISMIKKPMKML